MPDNRMHAERPQHLIEFYAILDRLETRVGGARKLVDCRGRMTWPHKSIYFFREPGELRTNSGAGPRIVRVGTHALHAGSGTKLWTRLSQHRGHIRPQGKKSISADPLCRNLQEGGHGVTSATMKARHARPGYSAAVGKNIQARLLDPDINRRLREGQQRGWKKDRERRVAVLRASITPELCALRSINSREVADQDG